MDTANPRTAQAPDDNQKTEYEIFGRLPNDWARDPGTSAECLCILAYRCTFADEKAKFGLWEDRLSREPILAGGFGEVVRARAIAEAVARGWLERPHNSKLPRGPGHKFARPIDRLKLPADLTRENSRMVWRTWFDGSLHRNEMGALLYIRAGTGKGPGVYARELEERFQWSAPTALAVLRALRRRGIIVMQRQRGARGRVKGVTYVVHPNLTKQLPAAVSEKDATTHKNPGDRQSTTHKKMGDGLLGDGLVGDIRRVPSTENLPDESIDGNRLQALRPQGEVVRPEGAIRSSARPTADPSVVLLAGASDERPFPASDYPPQRQNLRRDDDPFTSEVLLGWKDKLPRGRELELPPDQEDELMDELEEAYPDAMLSTLIRRATDGRVGAPLLTAGGLYAARYLAALSMYRTREDQEDGARPEDDSTLALATPQGAMEVLLRAMEDRFGRQPGQWMRSYAVIGMRLANQLYHGYVIGECPRLYRPRPTEEQLADGRSGYDALRVVREAGGWKVLAPELQDGPGAIAALLAYLDEVSLGNGCRRVEALAAVVLMMQRMAACGWDIYGRRIVPAVSSWGQLAESVAANIEKRTKTAC
jgi:hypothetical protein